MIFVNIETGKYYELINRTEDGFILTDEEKIYVVSREAFLYWYTTEEMWELHQKNMKKSAA